MKIELARHSGFCTGVRNAVTNILNAIKNCDEEILIHGPLIHSPQTMDILEKRGLKIIKENDSIDNRIIAIRTHGIPLQEFREIKKRAKRIINLTCLKVAYVQGIVKKYSVNGYFTIILGDKNHAEVLGISSYASSGFFIISDLEEIKGIPKADNYILVSQTTLGIEFFERAISLIKKKFQNIEIINTICTATSDRQGDMYNAVKKGADAIVVVGGKNSANTKRLAQIGRDNNIKTFHIETEDDLLSEEFNDLSYVIVSAGASTPSWIINNVLEKMYEIKYKNRTNLFYIFKSFFEFIIRTNILSALISIFITLAIVPEINARSFTMALLSATFIFIMYSINNIFRSKEIQFTKPFKYKLYSRYKYLILSMTILAAFFYLYFSTKFENSIIILYNLALISGFLYTIDLVEKINYRILKKTISIICGARSVVSSIGWIFVGLIIPYLANPYELYKFLSLCIIISSIIIVRNVLLDLIDYHGDLLHGIETFPTIFGMKMTRIVFNSLSFLFIISVFYNSLVINIYSLLYLINIIYYYILYKKIKNNYYFYILKYESLIDLNLMLFVLFSATRYILN